MFDKKKYWGQYYQKFRERMLEKTKQYNEIHTEKAIESRKKYYQKNKEKIKNRLAIYRQKNKEKIAQYYAQKWDLYVENNPKIKQNQKWLFNVQEIQNSFLEYKKKYGKITISDFQKTCGVPRSVLDRILNGKNIATFKNIEKMCLALGLDTKKILIKKLYTGGKKPSI